MMRAVVMLAASPAIVRACWPQLAHELAGAEITVYARARDLPGLESLLRGCEIRSDKPAGGRLAFLRELRAREYDVAYALRSGERDRWPCEALHRLARARRRRAIPDVASALGWWLVPHALGLAYRATLGRALGALLTLLRYALC